MPPCCAAAAGPGAPELSAAVTRAWPRADRVSRVRHVPENRKTENVPYASDNNTTIMQHKAMQLTKLSPPTAGSPSCILLTTGAMNPVHKGHVAMLHQAAARVRQPGFHVCATYLSQSHDCYVHPKARSLRTIGLITAFRLALAYSAVADDPLVAVVSWEAEFPGNWPDFPAVPVSGCSNSTGYSLMGECALRLRHGSRVQVRIVARKARLQRRCRAEGWR